MQKVSSVASGCGLVLWSFVTFVPLCGYLCPFVVNRVFSVQEW